MPERPWYQTEPNSKERKDYFYSLHPIVPGDLGEKQMVRVAGGNVSKDLREIVAGIELEDSELERRFKLLSQDSIYLGLGRRCRAAAGQERSDLFRLLSSRVRQIFIARDPEAILNNPQSFRSRD